MKPVRLVMEAFGPYAGTTTLDFQSLHGKPLVLLHGPTGGGKTAILDAMCFGLFGKSSGDERQGGDLRCDLAADDQLTRITFDFRHGERLLRVVREPTQPKKKSRGAGFTEHKTQAWLWDRTAVPHEGENEGLLLAEKPKGVDAEVRKILGFTEDQFRQIVVLPQGKFREFLSATAKDKEKILKSLFGTAIYEAITEELQKETATLKARFAENETKRNGILETVEEPDIASLADRIETMTAEISALKADAAQGDAQAVEANHALQRGEAGNKRIHEKVAAQEYFSSLDAQRSIVAEKEKRVQRIVEFKPLVPLAETVAQREKDLERANQTAQLAREELHVAEQNFAQAHELLNHEESQEKRQEREAAERRIVELEQLRDDVNAYQELVAKTTDAKVRLEKLVVAETETINDLSRMRARMAELERAADNLPVLEVEEVQGQQQEAEHHRQKVLFRDEEKLRMEIDGIDTECNSLRQKEMERSQALENALQRRAELYLRWHQGQAARLAAQLERGKPCPVCGSTVHPTPRVVPDKSLPSETMLQEADETLEGHRVGLEKIRLALTNLTARREGLVEQITDKIARLGAAATLARDEWLAQGDVLAASRKTREAKIASARAAAIDLKNAKDKAPALEAAVERTKTTREEAALHAKEMNTKLANCQERVPDELRVAEKYQQAMASALDQKNSCRSRLENAQSHEKKAEHAKLVASEKSQGAEVRVFEETQQLAQAKEHLRSVRESASLLDDKIYEDTLADATNEEQLQGEIRRFQVARDEARGRLEQAVLAAGDTALVDLDELKQKRDQAVSSAAEKNKILHDTESRLRFLMKEKKRYDDLVVEGGKDEERYRAIADLSEATAGRNPRRLSLQRYVLASLLDDVLAHASERLRNMSTGRYRVLRDDKLRDARAAGGLDLLIEDQYTGESRPISTLSGGESFQAALALSLGLADVIQALSGGIRVDSLFIDEGFGTLDGEALERAIEELLKLRDGGRLVGIISHVSELRHRISARIEVRKGERGSSIAVHAGD